MKGLAWLTGGCLLLVYMILPSTVESKEVFALLGLVIWLVASYNKNDKGLF